MSCRLILSLECSIRTQTMGPAGAHDPPDFTARPLVLQELAPLTGKHVLDLGCGEGYVARLVAQAGAQSVFGIDISSEMVGVHNRLPRAVHRAR